MTASHGPLPALPAVDFSPGTLFLFVGPREIRFPLTSLVASVAESGPIRLIIAGDGLETSLLDQLIFGNAALDSNIRRKTARTCHRLLAALAEEPFSPLPLFLLDFLSPFYTGSVHLSERKQILSACLDQLRLLKEAAGGGAVGLCPPRTPFVSARSLFRLVQSEAPRTFTAQVLIPGRHLGRLL